MIIDEAGMADTLSLDTAVQFAIDRGASVRLIGDDQQLAAIGAGGVLRDMQQSHGALHLVELHRFTNPAEAAASLGLRDGKPAALQTVIYTNLFASWASPVNASRAFALCFVLLWLGLMAILYRRGIFIKV